MEWQAVDDRPNGFARGSRAIGAVVLAAGAASRMGHRPKCLLELDGEPLVRRQCRALLDAGLHEVVVVLGHYADRIARALEGLPVARVRNPQPDAGQAASLRLGLRALVSEGVLVALADQPLITPQDIHDLLAAYRERPTGTQLVQPYTAGRPGNPVVFSAEVRRQMLAHGAAQGGRQWQAAHPEAVHRWPTANPHYATDVDSPADIEALALAGGPRLRWPADLVDGLCT